MSQDDRHPHQVMLMTFDKPVYADADYAAEASGPFETPCRTKLPEGIHLKSGQYTGSVHTKSGLSLYNVTFNYPQEAAGGVLSDTVKYESTYKVPW